MRFIGEPVQFITRGLNEDGTSAANVQPGIVSRVHSESCVSIIVFNECGGTGVVTSVLHASNPGDGARFVPIEDLMTAPTAPTT